MGGEAFDWWFDGNPAGSLRSVAVRDGAVVGAAGHSLARLVVGGREQPAQFSVHAVTAPEARGLGIFRATGVAARGTGQGTRLGVRARVRERTDAAVVPRAARLDPDRPAAHLGKAASSRSAGFAYARPVRCSARDGVCGARPAPGQSPDPGQPLPELALRRLAARVPPARRRGGGFAVVGFTRRRGLRLALLMELVAAERGRERAPARRPGGRPRVRPRCSPFRPRPSLARASCGTGSSRRAPSSTSWARAWRSRWTPARRHGPSRSGTRTSSEDDAGRLHHAAGRSRAPGACRDGAEDRGSRRARRRGGGPG